MRTPENEVSRRDTFRLTEKGRAHLQNNFNSDSATRILLALETTGNSNIDDIHESSGMVVKQIQRLIPSLLTRGYIDRIKTG